MKWIALIFDFLFGCHHHNLSRVFTICGETYCVCWNCGTKFDYSLANMSIVHRARTPQAATLRHVHTA